ncbi:MAG: amidohydrolase family protein [Planctomycetota bacterium]
MKTTKTQATTAFDVKNDKPNLLTVGAATCAVAAFLATPLHATPHFGGPFVQDEEGDDAAESSEPEHEWLVVENGDVYTGTGAVLRGASILVEDGKIKEIGYDLFVPDEARHIDVRGLRVYPGLVALGATSRVTIGRFAAQDPTWAVDTDVDPDAWMDRFDDLDDTVIDREGFKSRFVDSYDPFSPYMTLALANGITTVEQSGAAFKLKRDTIDGVVMSEDVTVSYNMRNGSSRASTRDAFAKASKYLRDVATWERLGKPKDAEPDKRGIDGNALRVLRNEVRAVFSSDDRSELLAIAQLGQEFGIRPIINGCREGWIVASELGRAGATCVIDPRDRRWNDPESLYDSGSSIENAAILTRAGCQVAITTPSSSIDTGGIAGRDLLSLSLQAGYAIRGGMSEADALAAITIVPARILGVDHRVGTIEIGKDADLLITQSDILGYETLVDLAIVGGHVAYDKTKELYYAHIRPHEILSDLEADAAAEEAAEEASSGDESKEDEPKEGESKGDDEGERGRRAARARSRTGAGPRRFDRGLIEGPHGRGATPRPGSGARAPDRPGARALAVPVGLATRRPRPRPAGSQRRRGRPPRARAHEEGARTAGSPARPGYPVRSPMILTHLLRVLGTGARGGRNLTTDEAYDAFASILDGRESEIQVGAFLVALRCKGVTCEELVGFARAARDRAKVPCEGMEGVVAVSSPMEGYESTPPLEVAAGFVAAAAGARVLLITDRGVPPKRGLTAGSVLHHLGAGMTWDAKEAEARVAAKGFAGVASVGMLPALLGLRRIRRDVAVRTPLATIEKLLAPKSAAVVLGAQAGPVLGTAVEVTQALGHGSALTIQGLEGGVIPPLGKRTRGIHLDGSHQVPMTLDPGDFGFGASREPELPMYGPPEDGQGTGDNPMLVQAAADQTLAVLAGEIGSVRSATLLTAAVMLRAARIVRTFAEGVDRASEALESGAASAVLAKAREK